MTSGFGQKGVGGIEKALDLLRTLPRVSLANLKGNPGANQKVRFHRIFMICRKY